MAHGAPARDRYTSEQYFALVDDGVLGPEDRVELLEGVIVTVAPANPRHTVVTHQVADLLRAAVGDKAVVRVQSSLRAGVRSVPEPDVAVVVGRHADYIRAHPTTALLVVEVADSSLAQDRITKTAIYAGAGVPEYWIVNLRDDVVEIHRAPDPETRRYVDRRLASRSEHIDVAAFPGVSIAVADLVPAS